jgi:serine protease Do
MLHSRSASQRLLLLLVGFTLVMNLNGKILSPLYADDVVLLDAPPKKANNRLTEARENEAKRANANQQQEIVYAPPKYMPGAHVAPLVPERDPLTSPAESNVPGVGSQISSNTEKVKSSDKSTVTSEADNESSRIKSKPESKPESKSNKSDSKTDSANPDMFHGRNANTKPPVDYKMGKIPLKILDYANFKLAPVFSKAQPEEMEDLIDLENHVAEIVKRTTAATVCVRSRDGSGSGVVISEDGWVLTAAHVTGRPGRKFEVIFPDGRSTYAVSYGTNHEDDAGLLKIEGENQVWPWAPVAQQAVNEGDWALCLGHPGGLQADRPPVARLGRVIRSSQHVVRTDCLIMPGDSGGPLFDMQGRVVGINSRCGPTQSLNYHTPAWVYLRDWDRLLVKETWGRPTETENPPHGFLGVEIDRTATEAKIRSIMAGMAAEKAEIKAGDIIEEVDNKEIRNHSDLVNYLARKKPGEKVKVIIRRDGQQLTKDVILSDEPEA